MTSPRMRTRNIPCPACIDNEDPGFFWDDYENCSRVCTLCRGKMNIDIEVDTGDKRRYAPLTDEQRAIYADLSVSSAEAARIVTGMGHVVSKQGVWQWRKKHGLI